MDQILGNKNIVQTPPPWDKSKLDRGDKSIKKWYDAANWDLNDHFIYGVTLADGYVVIEAFWALTFRN